MFSAVRSRLTYANVAVTLALVFAMSGGAYAASKYVITSTKQISPKVLKTLKSAKGANGANGAAGPAGAQGAQGSQGPAGPGGPAGPAGGPGPKGESGAAGKNGTNGTNGKDGSPWTVGGTLPEGATETGVWNMEGVISTATGVFTLTTAVSFTVPLASGLDKEHVHFVAKGTAAPTGCLSGTVEKPEAESGNVCVYEAHAERLGGASIGTLEGGVQGASTAGALLLLQGNAEGLASANGAWAVTG